MAVVVLFTFLLCAALSAFIPHEYVPRGSTQGIAGIPSGGLYPSQMPPEDLLGHQFTAFRGSDLQWLLHHMDTNGASTETMDALDRSRSVFSLEDMEICRTWFVGSETEAANQCPSIMARIALYGSLRIDPRLYQYFDDAMKAIGNPDKAREIRFRSFRNSFASSLSREISASSDTEDVTKLLFLAAELESSSFIGRSNILSNVLQKEEHGLKALFVLAAGDVDYLEIATGDRNANAHTTTINFAQDLLRRHASRYGALIDHQQFQSARSGTRLQMLYRIKNGETVDLLFNM